MTKTEIGDISLLKSIKDQLELGTDDCLKGDEKTRIDILEEDNKSE